MSVANGGVTVSCKAGGGANVLFRMKKNSTRSILYPSTLQTILLKNNHPKQHSLNNTETEIDFDG